MRPANAPPRDQWGRGCRGAVQTRIKWKPCRWATSTWRWSSILFQNRRCPASGLKVRLDTEMGRISPQCSRDARSMQKKDTGRAEEGRGFKARWDSTEPKNSHSISADSIVIGCQAGYATADAYYLLHKSNSQKTMDMSVPLFIE